ncbi:alpha/beta fold hydrolase [Kitasatospora sp. GP82]|uniref:alpha/beta fold hydrolase n=1 Tax=Kitasatospora sp. GP82 TaxID=3035089 RepID=UPI0024745AD8|nr:alpha/beta fold hydrolase [Kitasatospora sp. GP82]MDH6125839.1 pimeloyl-ACP methyl ester carboxylesterase [Kitasatospora sp. GP82]
MDLVHERRGDGPPLLLLHGIGHRWQGWKPVLDLLAREREVIAVDLPGFGASPPLPAGMPYTIGSAITVLGDFLESIGIERPHVAGNSLGGLFTLHAARHGLASSATVLSPAGFYRRTGLRYASGVLSLHRFAARTPEVLRARLAEHPQGRKAMFGMIYGRPERLDPRELLLDTRALLQAPGFRQTLHAGRAELAPRFPADLPAQVPVTIAWGTRDRLLPNVQGRRARRILPTARFVPLPGCGHVPMGDDPALVARVLLDGSSSPLLGLPHATAQEI